MGGKTEIKPTVMFFVVYFEIHLLFRKYQAVKNEMTEMTHCGRILKAKARFYVLKVKLVCAFVFRLVQSSS